MQAKISAFFKPSIYDPGKASELSRKKNKDLGISVVYECQNPQEPNPTGGDDPNQLDKVEMEVMNGRSYDHPPSSQVVNKKRSYVQYHLELGQRDFLLHTCSVCGLMYARGDKGDEKTHKAFHKDFYEGFQFKGWNKERVVSKPSGKDRIILVLDGDPFSHKQKVLEVVKVMERELGFTDGQLLHNLCKVYLFISSQRIVGCLIAEPIKRAHKMIPGSASCFDADIKYKKKTDSEANGTDQWRCNSTLLQFGNVSFQREVIRKDCSPVDQWDAGAILCEEAAVPALCGIKAVWVVPSKRRQRIASKLLDAVLVSFGDDCNLDVLQCAFSAPTSAGKAFASRYTGSKAFLIYGLNDV